MTSFTKALFRRNPGAALELRQVQLHQLRYGRHVTLAQFTPSVAAPDHPAFGKRTPSGSTACAQLCGHPACSQGCTLVTAR